MLKGLSHEKLFRHISCKNASEIRWARWKKWKSPFSTLILDFISTSSQLMALKKRDCVHNSSLSFWEDVHNLSLRYVEDVHNLSLKQWDCPELVTEKARLSTSRHWNFETVHIELKQISSNSAVNADLLWYYFSLLLPHLVVPEVSELAIAPFLNIGCMKCLH